MSGQPRAERTTILVHEWVTGGGLAGSPMIEAWEAEGHAIRRSIVSDFARVPDTHVIFTLDERFPDEPGPWTVVPIKAGADESPMMTRLGDEVRRLATQADFTILIAPEQMGLHAGLAEQVESAGGQLLGSSSEAIDKAGHKLWLADHLTKHGIATPASRLIIPADGLPADATYPAVLKPVTGSGSVQTYLVERPGPCPKGAAEMANALLQPFVPGTPMSASFLVTPDGRAGLLGVGWQRMERTRTGRFLYQGGRMPAPKAWGEGEPLRAVESIPGLRGFVGVDFIWDEEAGRATVIEINPRPTTSYVGLSRLLPAGTLATAWRAVSLGYAPEGYLNALAELIDALRPIVFSADGTIESYERGFRK